MQTQIVLHSLADLRSCAKVYELTSATEKHRAIDRIARKMDSNIPWKKRYAIAANQYEVEHATK